MFTGIIEVVGAIRQARAGRGGVTLAVEAPFGSGPLVAGESVAVSGPCLTVERVVPGGFECFASSETLARTTLGRARAGTRVNLERALRADGRLGGHIVSGHVDGVGRLRGAAPAGQARELSFDAPPGVARYLAEKGSIAIDGVSLTVNAVREGAFSVMVIPHTLSATTLEALRPGDDVNLEADVVARYVEALLSRGGGGGLTEDRLRELGYLA